MNKFLVTSFTILATATATPALADSAVDTDSMTETVSRSTIQPVTLSIDGFMLVKLGNAPDAASFMATANQPGPVQYRLTSARKAPAEEPQAGLAGLFVPAEFAYRSTAQDSGVDAVTPGRFLSSSVRADYLPDAGPGAADKSSVGVRFGF